jgi:hypothetical protein
VPLELTLDTFGPWHMPILPARKSSRTSTFRTDRRADGRRLDRSCRVSLDGRAPLRRVLGVAPAGAMYRDVSRGALLRRTDVTHKSTHGAGPFAGTSERPANKAFGGWGVRRQGAGNPCNCWVS